VRRITVTTAIAAVAIIAAGCGGGDNGSQSAGGGQKVALSAPADGRTKFEPAKLTAKAGKVTIDFDNPSSVPHAVTLEGDGVDASSGTVTNAKTSVTADLKPGTYEYYCPVSDHHEEGMEGRLTVR
jgi:plastocyanin